MGGQHEPALEILLDAEAISRRVDELATEIAQTYDLSETTLVGALVGAFVFTSDLIRRLPQSPLVDFIRVASYGDGTSPQGAVKLIDDVAQPVSGRRVLLIEDIIDTGRTAEFIVGHLKAQGAESVYLVTFLDKPSRRVVPIRADHVGYVIDNVFVVGYGMDLAGRFRNLPVVARVCD